MAKLNGIPGDPQVWRIDGKRVYLMYQVETPDGLTVPMLWHVPTPEDLAAMFGPGVPVRFDRELTQVEADRLGAVDFGSTTEIVNTSEHPFETVLATWEQEAAIRPWLRDPEIMALTMGAILEGRGVTDAELKTTDWWKSRTEAERARLAKAASDPASFAADLEDWRIKVRDMLVAGGYQNPPSSLVDYYAQQVNQGTLSEAQLGDALRRETDPFAPGASPFAGHYLPEGASVVRRGDDYFIRTEAGDYRLTGPGQIARYGEGAQRLAPDAQYFTDGRVHALKLPDGTWRHADGPGQIAEMQRIYGDPTVVPSEHIGPDAGNVIDLFRAGDPKVRMEDFAAGTLNEVGTAADLFAGVGVDATGLGGEEEVRRLLMHWLGPMFGGHYSDEWIAEWAGRIRNGGRGATDQLVEYLRRTAKALFPNHDEGLPYEAIAAPWRGLYAQYAGQPPNEATDAVFHRVVNTNDARAAELLLRQEGLRRGWTPVMSEARSGLSQQSGAAVIGSAV